MFKHFLCFRKRSSALRYCSFNPRNMSADTKWSAGKVRQTFIDFFCNHAGHTFKRSSPVLPHDDPTLLFANAGMNQFKSIFLGQVNPSSPLYGLKRACNSQKCIRAGGKHNDLDDVGKDTYHHTFFEMLGNWSFGNYFKEEAIGWAWKLLTEVYGLDKSRLYITYFGGDASQGLEPDLEARDIWLKYVPTERILPFDCKDNFWEMGETGPCGPCSEIHYDRIGNRDGSDLVNADLPDMIEIWNLVFMQYNRIPGGKLEPLPAKHIDTGMGFERLASILQGKDSNYDTDIFVPIFKAIQEVTGHTTPYSGKVGDDDTDGMDMAYRVIADHIRTLSIAITDGVRPDNADRGYVLRRILRRAARTGRVFFKTQEPFFYKLVPCVVDLMKGAFPELEAKQDYVMEILKEEEISFLLTLDKGENHLSKLIEKLRKKSTRVIPGKEAFILYSRYGFPIDLTQIAVEQHGFTVDMHGFEMAREADRDCSRRVQMDSRTQLKLGVQETHQLSADKVPVTDCEPMYTSKDIPANVLRIFTENREFVDIVSETQHSGVEIGVVLDRTSFYPEQGGQTFDTGEITNENFTMTVRDTQSFAGYILHIGDLINGTVSLGDSVETCVDYARRRRVMPNHTFTHVLNHSLLAVLGQGIDQKGSRVFPDKLTFDFNSKAMTPKEISTVEAMTAKTVQEALPVYSESVPLEEARKIVSLRAVFGETYPDPVRVVSIGKEVKALLKDPENAEWWDYSIELCGGTHIKNTSEGGAFVLTSEAGIAKGIRRVVCVTGADARAAITRGEELLTRFNAASQLEGENLGVEIAVLDDLLKKTSQDGEVAVSYTTRQELSGLLKALRKTHLKWAKLRAKQREKAALEKAATMVGARAEFVTPCGEGRECIVQQMDLGLETKVMQKVVTTLQKGLPDIPIMVISADPTSQKKSKVMAYCSMPQSLTESHKLKAADWLQPVMAVLGGKGNGKATTAQGQGTMVTKVDSALKTAVDVLQEALSA
eukprot:933159_1